MSDIIILGTPINPYEAFASILGIIAVFFQIKEKIAFWPLWLITSFIYIFIFFESKLYALMTLQFYYVGNSIYGWYKWQKGVKEDSGKIKSLTPKQWGYVILAAIIMTVVFYFVLDHYTDSTVPALDGLVTALSFTASWLLAQKFLQQWLFWIIADSISIYVYFTQELYPTCIFFTVLTIMATIGYFQWKKVVKTY